MRYGTDGGNRTHMPLRALEFDDQGYFIRFTGDADEVKDWLQELLAKIDPQ